MSFGYNTFTQFYNNNNRVNYLGLHLACLKMHLIAQSIFYYYHYLRCWDVIKHFNSSLVFCRGLNYQFVYLPSIPTRTNPSPLPKFTA